jgi:hypothetical protein
MEKSVGCFPVNSHPFGLLLLLLAADEALKTKNSAWAPLVILGPNGSGDAGEGFREPQHPRCAQFDHVPLRPS